MSAKTVCDVVRTQFWLGELLLHPDVQSEQARFRAGAGLPRLEFALRGDAERGAVALKNLKRYQRGERACRTGNDGLVALANIRFPGSARPFRSPIWFALGSTTPSREDMQTQALVADWSSYWEMTLTDVDSLVHFDHVDALGCLLIHVALSEDRTNIGVFAQSHLVGLWFQKNWTAERLAQTHVRTLVNLIRSRFFGRLILPADLTALPPLLPLLDWA